METRPGSGHIDREKLEDLRKLERPGNEGFLRRILSVFLTDAERRVQEMSGGIRSGDGPAVAMAAHTLKGSCSYIGAFPLAELCRRVEEQAEQSSLTAESIQAVREELAAVFDVLNGEMRNIDDGGTEPHSQQG